MQQSVLGLLGIGRLCGAAAAQTFLCLMIIIPPFFFFPYLKCFKKDLYSETVESCSLKTGNLQCKVD